MLSPIDDNSSNDRDYRGGKTVHGSDDHAQREPANTHCDKLFGHDAAEEPATSSARETAQDLGDASNEKAHPDSDPLLCQYCKDVLHLKHGKYFRSSRGTIWMQHHTSTLTLRTSQRGGCWICSTICRALTAKDWERLSSLSHEQLFYTQCDVFTYDLPEKSPRRTDRPIKLYFSAGVESSNSSPLGVFGEMNFILIPKNPMVDTEIPLVVCTSPSTSSLETWATAKQWVADCDSSHTCLDKHDGNNWYPTRLLDLEVHSNAIRVVETETKSMSGHYITLSHRWGTAQPLALTQETKDTLFTGAPVLHLPRTFRQAVEVCRRLNVRWLWIDSLCIFQDDTQDWVRESSSMREVYSRSYLTLSATAALDSNEGLFSSRRSTDLTEKAVTTNLNNSLQLGDTPISYRLFNDSLWNLEVDNSPLNTRGWVLQERLLSPRVLHFGSSQIYWECRGLDHGEAERMEVYPDMGFLGARPSPSRPSLKDLEFIPEGESQVANDIAFLDRWAGIVYKYTQCELTKSTDKLVAISGLAKLMASRCNTEYVAGMWRRHLSSQLLWTAHKTSKSMKNPRRQTSYLAPTFSWASLDGSVGLNCPATCADRAASFDITAVRLNYATGDVFGMLQEGSYLTIRCLLQSARVIRRRDTESIIINEDESYSITQNRTASSSSDPSVFLDENVEYFDPVGCENLYCVPVRYFRDKDVWQIDYLLVQPVDTQCGAYRRFGTARVYQDVVEQVHTICWPARHPSEADFPCVSYDGDRHTIKLI